MKALRLAIIIFLALTLSGCILMVGGAKRVQPLDKGPLDEAFFKPSDFPAAGPGAGPIKGVETFYGIVIRARLQEGDTALIDIAKDYAVTVLGADLLKLRKQVQEPSPNPTPTPSPVVEPGPEPGPGPAPPAEKQLGAIVEKGLWKPVSEGDGKLAIAQKQASPGSAGARCNDPRIGDEVGEYVGQEGHQRHVWRFNHPGSHYTGQVLHFCSGQYRVHDGSKRWGK